MQQGILCIHFNAKLIKQNQMYIAPTKQQIIEQAKIFYSNLIHSIPREPVVLNVSLVSNPFLKDRDSYKYLKQQLNEYNKRCGRSEVKDQYEIISFNRLHSMLADLAQIDSRDNQSILLEQLTAWFKGQTRLIKQRSSQGQVRHQITKAFRQFTRIPQQNNKEHDEQLEFQIPFYQIQRKMAEYQSNNRTIHKQEESPEKALANYKRKITNIINPLQVKEIQIKNPRVLYPVPPKFQPAKEQQNQILPIEGQETNPTLEEKSSVLLPQGEQSTIQPLNAEISQVQSIQADMGGFGQEPQEPEQQQPPQDVPDKLKPKNPVFVHAVATDDQPKYKQSYLFYLGNDSRSERNMQMRAIRKYHNDMREKKQDSIQLQLAHEWAKRKSKMAKDIQKRMQQMKFKAAYTISNQPSPRQQKLNYGDELKYGFTTIVKQKPKTKDYDLSYNQLPRIGKYALEQKTIRSDRLSSLKNKFAKILNLVEEQYREPTQSMCQVAQRRHRGISEIIKNHSQQKERMSQLQQVCKLKERLSRAKININYSSLSKGICLPQNDESIEEGEMKFPSKDLPSNPNLIETKKKKKKK